jgi:hypothetical protein
VNETRLTQREVLAMTDASERTPSRLRDALAPATLPGQSCWASEVGARLFGVPGCVWECPDNAVVFNAWSTTEL